MTVYTLRCSLCLCDVFVSPAGCARTSVSQALWVTSDALTDKKIWGYLGLSSPLPSEMFWCVGLSVKMSWGPVYLSVTQPCSLLWRTYSEEMELGHKPLSSHIAVSSSLMIKHLVLLSGDWQAQFLGVGMLCAAQWLPGPMFVFLNKSLFLLFVWHVYFHELRASAYSSCLFLHLLISNHGLSMNGLIKL